jgi:hypothetical protein
MRHQNTGATGAHMLTCNTVQLKDQGMPLHATQRKGNDGQ